MRKTLPILVLMAATALVGVPNPTYSNQTKLDSGMGGGKASDSHTVNLMIILHAATTLLVDKTGKVVEVRSLYGGVPKEKIWVVERDNPKTRLIDNKGALEQYDLLLKNPEIDWNARYVHYELKEDQWVTPQVKVVEPEKVNGVTAYPQKNEFGMTSGGTMSIKMSDEYYDRLKENKRRMLAERLRTKPLIGTSFTQD